MANKNLNNMHMVAGLDIGNGYVKGSTSVNGKEKLQLILCQVWLFRQTDMTSRQKKKMKNM